MLLYQAAFLVVFKFFFCKSCAEMIDESDIIQNWWSELFSLIDFGNMIYWHRVSFAQCLMDFNSKMLRFCFIFSFNINSHKFQSCYLWHGCGRKILNKSWYFREKKKSMNLYINYGHQAITTRCPVCVGTVYVCTHTHTHTMHKNPSIERIDRNLIVFERNKKN